MLNIQCPSCNSSFQAENSFLGKLVECGKCKTQFTVDSSTIEPKKAAIPEGNTNHPVFKRNNLSGFNKTFQPTSDSPSAQRPQYDPKLKEQIDSILPLSPQKKAANIVGGALLTFGILLLLAGTTLTNGFLVDTNAEYINRFILATFFAVTCGICFITGARRKSAGILKFLVVLVFLGVLSYLLPKGPEKLEKPDPTYPPLDKTAPIKLTNTQTSIESLKKASGYEPLQEAINTAQEQGDTNADSVIGIWLTGNCKQYQYSVQDYYKNALDLEQRPVIYPRKEGLLLILTNLEDVSFEKASEISGIFGNIQNVFVSEKLICLTYDEKRFSAIDDTWKEQVIDPSNGKYYALNLKELQHFDHNRVLAAVQRLAVAQIRYKPEITVGLLKVLERFNNIQLLNKASLCLLRWSEGTTHELLNEIEPSIDYEKKGFDAKLWPPYLVRLLLAAGSEKIIPVTLELWKANTVGWETIIIESKKNFSRLVASEIDLSDRAKNLSIIRIVGELNSPDKESILFELRSKLDNTYDVAIDYASK